MGLVVAFLVVLNSFPTIGKAWIPVIWRISLPVPTGRDPRKPHIERFGVDGRRWRQYWCSMCDGCNQAKGDLMRLSTNRRGVAWRLQQGLVTDFAAKQRRNNKAIKFGLRYLIYEKSLCHWSCVKRKRSEKSTRLIGLPCKGGPSET